jgi:bifunctional DNase/RNase
MRYIRWLLVFVSILVIRGPLDAAQEETVETKVKTMLLDPTTNAPVIVLETVADKKLVPIWIDIPEARAIALELQHVPTPRPLTHDLIRNILQSLGATLQRVTITDIRDNTYFAVLHLRVKGEELQIDSRPSDAIAVALRMNAPIFTAVQVLAKSKPAPAPGAPAEQLRHKLGVQSQSLTGPLPTLIDVQLLNAVRR